MRGRLADVDGYAVIAADTASATPAAPCLLTIIERVFTGHAPTRGLARGQCAEIATGAPLPDGADAVVMVEETVPAADGQVGIRAAAAAGQNIGRRGAEISPGDFVVRTGDLLNPSRIGAMAAIGCADVEVFCRPRVAVLSTGNEVVEPGHALAGAQIYDVNRFTLAAVIEAHGGSAEPHPPARDTIESLETALAACAGADVMIFSGGSSVGERDLIVDLVERHGTMVFHGIAVKPGKPIAFGTREDGKVWFGLPGNPLSTWVGFLIFVSAWLGDELPRESRQVARKMDRKPGREEFLPAQRLPSGEVTIRNLIGSHANFGLLESDGLVRINPDVITLVQGEHIDFLPFPWNRNP